MATKPDDYPSSFNGGEPPPDEHDTRIGEVDHEGESERAGEGHDGTPAVPVDKVAPVPKKGTAP